jgi:hypothetical protein
MISIFNETDSKMLDWKNPDPFQLKALHEALLFAYPTSADLNTFLTLHIGQSYSQLAPPSNSYRNGLLEILIEARSSGWLEKLVQQARQNKPKSPKLLVLDRNLKFTSADVPLSLGRDLEAIVRVDGGFHDLMPWVEKLEELGHRSCRIEYPVNTPRGTGWLVGQDRLLTNWHVIESALPKGQGKAAEYVCRFDYAVTPTGTLPGTEARFAADWCVDASPPSSAELGTGHDAPSADTLDYALIRLAKSIGSGDSPAGKKRGWIEVTGNEALPQEKDIIFVIQHPDGLPVKLSAGDIQETSLDKLRLFHTANTRGGSSGSVVVNAKLDPIGLHHAGDMLYQYGKIGNPQRNQAVPIGCIVNRIKANGNWN